MSDLVSRLRMYANESCGGRVEGDLSEAADRIETLERELAEARKQERERCAKVCDELLERETMSMHASHIQCLTARGAMSKCAAAIRGMKDE